MENRSHALLAGIFTLVFLLVAAAALWWLGGAHQKTHTYLLETRNNITGLNIETQVRYRGIRAGKVRDIRTDPTDSTTLLVEIALDQRYRLTDKTEAKLNQQGVTGLSYVMLDENVEDGVPGNPLPVDGAVPPRIRIQPGLLEQLGERAGDIVGHLTELSVRLNRMLDERNLRNLARTLDNLAVASDSLREVPRLMAALHAVLSSDNVKRLNAVLAQVERTAGATAPLAAEAQRTLATLNALARRLEGLADTAGQTGQRLNAETLPRSEALMHDVAAAMRRLEHLLDMLNDNPQSVLFGGAAGRPGPGESGFAAPTAKE